MIEDPNIGRRHVPPVQPLTAMTWRQAAVALEELWRKLHDGFSGKPAPHGSTHLSGDDNILDDIAASDQTLIAGRAFGARPPAAEDLADSQHILVQRVLTHQPQTFVDPAAATDLILAAAFLHHPLRVPAVQAGTNVTIVENALGPVISATGGGSAVDSDQNILATQVFGQ